MYIPFRSDRGVGQRRESSRFFNLLSFFASLPVSGPDWVLVLQVYVVVKVFNNFTVGDSVSFPFLSYLKYFTYMYFLFYV